MVEFAWRDGQEEEAIVYVYTHIAICVHTHTHHIQGIVEFASREHQEEAIAKLDDKEFKNNFDGSRTYLRVL
jgi:hypothetical protein